MKNPWEPETIAAIATAPGRGGIGVVRLSGPLARTIVEPILRLKNPLAPGRARFAELLDPAALLEGPATLSSPAVLDQAVVTFFAAPNSYTSEDVVEIALHGAPVLLDAVLRYTCSQGARLAEPGEFTQRAFLSGRLDLTAAEAVRDLIDAQTLHQARVAAAQLGGSVSRAVEVPKRNLLSLIATLEAGIDFAEDDLDLLPHAALESQLQHLSDTLRRLASSYSFGRILRDGYKVALVGQPNAGKSSLFNRILGSERSIVTQHPGTTRDLITEQFVVAGVPVELIDTAGLRELDSASIHEAERAGIVRTHTALAEAHHVLLIVGATTLDEPAALSEPDAALLASQASRPVTVVLNKADLLSPDRQAHLARAFPGAILVSASTGEGLPNLRSTLESALTSSSPPPESTLITDARQHKALLTAIDAVDKAASAPDTLPQEMLLLDLYAALAALDDLTGATPSDAILQQIFSTFCIGK